MTAGWPIEPLEKLLAVNAEATHCHERASAMPSIHDYARTAGVTPRTWHRWANHGLSDMAADCVAITIGLHPLLIWPDW